MSKPADVSQEAWEIAQAVWCELSGTTDSSGPAPQVIARSIMAATLAEREQCALIAEDKDGLIKQGWGHDAAARARYEVAATIRKRGTP